MQAFFASNSSNAPSHYLAPPASSSRLPALRIGEDIDDFLSSDLELSFASNMSLQSPEKHYRDDSDVMMDISPAPLMRPSASENVDLSGRKPISNRARSATMSSARLFGRDVGNNPSPASAFQPLATKTSSKRTQRAALPVEWMSQMNPPSSLAAPSSPDAMDIDSSYSQSLDRPFVDLSSPAPAPLSAAPTVTGFDTFSPLPPLSAAPTIKGFDIALDTISQEQSRDDISAHPTKKRWSMSPPPSSGRRRSGTLSALDSSPMAPSSPSVLKLERIMSNGTNRLGKPMLPGLGNPDSVSNPSKRLRRPQTSSMVAPHDALRSAYPIMDSRAQYEQRPPLAPARRAFSAMLAPGSGPNVSLSSESSFDDSGDMSSPAAAHARRQQTKTLRRIEGTDDFRATGSLRMQEQTRESPRVRSSPECIQGLGAFGDNEAAGKVLPCHRVREDGLMRIKPSTLDDLLDGKYDSRIDSFLIVDCRFDYEYNGGHIPGAINIRNTEILEEYFLGPNAEKPVLSTSGSGPKKKILIFHCEFSVKRAPTFAKHLRSKDRSMNSHCYPKVFYPEVYVLEGGFNTFYKVTQARIRPSGYVRMDDPEYAESRKEDLDQFRKGKFGRTRSYAYGDPILGGNLSKVSKRISAPSASSGQPLFAAAANAARSRRGGLDTLAEDRGQITDDDETDIGDSPCPAPTKSAAFRGKRLGGLARGLPLGRAETYDPSRLAAY